MAKWFTGLAFCLLLVGCGPSQQQVEEQSTLKPLGILHGRYAAQHKGEPPPNEAEFKKFVESLGPESLQSIGAADATKLWISSRDKQPYGIVYGKNTGPPGPAGQPVVVYEVQGSGGKRMVGSQLGAVDEVDEARFRELVPSAAAAP
jgi:hypothetical protein